MSDTHCDEVVEDYTAPNCLRYFLFVNRLPAALKCMVIEAVGEPKCFATYEGKTVRLVMASRMGDVGITDVLTNTKGYQQRVSVDMLDDPRATLNHLT